MRRPSAEEMAEAAKDVVSVRSLIPPLFKGYLRLGAKICGEPLFDPLFGTIDFFIVLDVAKLPERYTKHFNVELTVPAEKAYATC